MLKAVIFDLDGTLVDTIGDIADCMNNALSDMGFPTRGEAEFYRLVGNGMLNLAYLCLPEERRDEKTVAECRDRAVRLYSAAPAVRSRPYPGTAEMLSALAAKNIPRAVLTNKPDPIARAVIAAVLPGGGFSIVRGEIPGRPRKPDPTAALEIAAAMGAEPGETILVGDSDVDMITAARGGFFSAGAAWGFRGRRELEDAGADRIIESPQDLLPLFRSESN